MTDELLLVHETVRAVLKDIPDVEADEGWSPTAWRDLDQTGLTRVGVTERVGGTGGGVREAAVALHAVGNRAAPVPLAEATLLGGWLLESAGMALPGGVLSVAHGGVARRAGPAWELTGSVDRVAWGRVADHLAVLSESDSGPVVALVPTAECHVVPGRNLAGEYRDTLTLPAVTVASTDAGTVSANIDRQLRLRGALCRVIAMAGAAEAVLDMTIRYVDERSQFGRPLRRFQVVQHTLARMAEESAAMSAAARASLDAIATREVDWPSVAAAKVRAGRGAGELAAMAHQLHGALGVTWEHRLRRFTTRLWAWREEYGSEAEWARQIGAWVIKTGPAAARSAVVRERSEAG